jgi:molybdopterin molybdotransferase
MREGLSVAEAQEQILAFAAPLGAETVASADAQGRILVDAVVATRTLPPEDNSAMDGYAVRAADLAATPVSLPVVYEVPAGAHAPRPLAPGESARILTGAPLPPGADAVVRQEDVALEGDRVRIRVAVSAGEHVRRAGEDVDVGETILASGARLGPAQLGMLASLGRSQVAVHQRPQVALLSGGDELVEPDGDVGGGRIVSSNSYTLAAQCREVGAVPHYLGIARDEPADIERRLRAGLRCHALVSSAGVSVGDRDHVRSVLESLGCKLEFWGVRMKPGYPVVFGRFADGSGPLVFGLPGNPVSAMVTFEVFVRPALLRMAGHHAIHRPRIPAVLGETFTKKAGRLHFVRVRLERAGPRMVARATGNQSSGVLRSMTEAHGLLIFPAEATRLSEGDVAPVLLLDETFLSAPDPGFA